MATQSCHTALRRLASSMGLAATILLGFSGGALAQFSDSTSGSLGDAGNGQGVAWGDYDNDGDLDLYLSNFGQANKLFRNDGGGTFVDATSSPLDNAGDGQGVAWGDYDNDGDLDLYLANFGQSNMLFRNEGGDTFVDASSLPVGDPGNSTGVTWGDYDNDGDIDLYVAHYGQANKLFRNDGGDTFVDATSGPLGDTGPGVGVAWADYDNDNDLDLYLVNNYGANKLFRNDGGGTFVDATSGPLGDAAGGFGVAWGDYDNDGDLDIYLTNDGQANKLFRNDGGGTFGDATIGPLGDTGYGNGVAWGDYDNDGDLDLYLANIGSNKLLRNDGSGTFVDATTDPLGDAGSGYGVGWGDYDNDGGLDLYLANYNQTNKLMHNEATAGSHWLQVKLQGAVSNRAGIGARVKVVAGGATRIREISGGSGFLSQDAMMASFGLESATSVDLVEVRWPSRLVQVVSPPPAMDGAVTVMEVGPAISAVSDIPGDQGGWVRVNLAPPGNDRVGEDLPIANYFLWRRVESAALAGTVLREGVPLLSSATGLAKIEGLDLGEFDVLQFGDRLFVSSGPSASADATTLPPGLWEVVGSAPAIQQPNYLIASPTLADSTEANGFFWSTFVVSAHTPIPSVWFASAPDSGYSVDNIAPGVPQNIIANYDASAAHLDWDDARETDFQFYRVYRDTDPGFVPSEFNLHGQTAESSFEDPSAVPWQYSYKVSSIDYSGNEGPAGSPGTVTGVNGPSAATRFALHEATPNPFNPQTVLSFSLPAGGHVRLTIYNVAGRYVATLLDEARTAGRHELVWAGRDDQNRPVASGVYHYRIEAGTFVETKRMLLLK